jgi:lipopolysaccharide transport system permease protein
MDAVITIISAERHERIRQFLKDLWDYRELFWTFVERDVKVRYKQTALGVVWVILQPLFLMGAFSLIFGKIAKMPTDGLPYSLFYLAALVPWNTFAAALSQSALSMEANAHLISKVYFPRIVVPGGVVCGSLVDFTIGWTLLNVVSFTQGYWSIYLILVTPLLLVLQCCTALGVGLVLAALNAQYRDVKHVIGFIVQVLMLATPVIYPASKLPISLQPYIFLNPMAVVIATYRDILQGDALRWAMLILAMVMAGLYLGFGVWFFRKREQRMADVL